MQLEASNAGDYCDSGEHKGAISYFLFDGDAIKIGSSSSIEGALRRCMACQTGNPRPIEFIGVTNIRERDLHEMFAEDRIRGEWFRVSHKLLKFIASADFSSVVRFRENHKQKWRYTKEIFELKKVNGIHIKSN